MENLNSASKDDIVNIIISLLQRIKELEARVLELTKRVSTLEG